MQRGNDDAGFHSDGHDCDGRTSRRGGRRANARRTADWVEAEEEARAARAFEAQSEARERAQAKARHESVDGLHPVEA